MDLDSRKSDTSNNTDAFAFGVMGTDPRDMGIIDPNGRLKVLSDYGNSVEIDANIPPRRYYRSGLEMVRMANVYLDEGSLENAYILYMKFMTLFLEKIRHHPQYSVVSVTDRAINSQKLREVLPKAEQLKSRLLVQYQTEYQRYVAETKQREKRAREQRAKEEKQNEEEDNKRQLQAAAYPVPSIPTVLTPAPPVGDIQYPDYQTCKPSNLKIEIPTFDRNTKPTSILSPSMLSKLGLRDVIVPSRLMDKFLILAKRNTDQDVETCGILAGHLNHDQLIISHLLIPKQSGTSDSCATHNEEEIFDYQDEHDLITLGWIHTHPTQTAFLSSVDLHTHCSYQLMMPEAIAIVCAPRYKDIEIFVLTPTYGLGFVSSCRLSGFHPHPTQPPLFMKAEHAKIDADAIVEVVDLRR